MTKSPIWRATFATLAGTVDTQVQRLLGSEALAVAIGLAHAAHRDITKRTESTTARVWHGLNLPTGNDVTRLLVQLGSVEREIRELEKRIGDASLTFGNDPASGKGGEVIVGAKAHRSDRGPRSHPS